MSVPIAKSWRGGAGKGLEGQRVALSEAVSAEQ
jgi:hypothetical protein